MINATPNETAQKLNRMPGRMTIGIKNKHLRKSLQLEYPEFFLLIVK